MKRWDNIKTEQAAWFLVWFTLPLSLKAGGAALILASLVVLLLFVARPFLPDRRKIAYLAFPVLFFLWHAFELFFERPVGPAWKETERLLSFLVIPLLFSLSRIGKASYEKAAMAGFLTALILCGVIMLVAAAWRFLQSGNGSEFTYHALATPFRMGAIYFSCYLLFALFMTGEPGLPSFYKRYRVPLALFMLALLLLSASKLFIGFGLPLLAWHHRRHLVNLWHRRRAIFLLIVVALLLGSLPFLKRARSIVHPDLKLVAGAGLRDAPEPDGLTLRLILWRFGFEIMEEQQAWIRGTGMVRSQPLLDAKIAGAGMYTGIPGTADTGYLGYNYHNQFIETGVRKGVTGAVLLIMILVIFATRPRERLFTPKIFMLVMCGFFLTESVLERQAGIVFFCLLYSAYFIDNNDVVNPNAPHE